MRIGRQVLITRELAMSSSPQAGQLLVRRPGYGAMQLAGLYAFGPPLDRASAIGVLQAAVAAGVDHIDTADYYGPGVVQPDPGRRERLAGTSTSRCPRKIGSAVLRSPESP
jgi:aryl-alcohol dehydrogenase-like predicted oxidoreductase